MSKPWQDMTDRERDALVAENVMGWQRVESPGMRITLLLPGEMAKASYGIRMAASWDRIGDVSVPVATLSKTVEESGLEWLWRKHARDTLPHYSTDITAAWEIVKAMISRMGYNSPGFDWQGPIFKPEHHYLTREGYPLGTTCWFVRLEADGYIQNICAETPEHAICLAALKAVGYEEA